MRPRPNSAAPLRPILVVAVALLLGAVSLCARAPAQVGRDPLTPDEASQLQDAAGDLDKRVDLLLQFARQRLTEFESVRTASPRPPDRANTLYELLREYEEILPELDDNIDEMADGYHTSETGSTKYSLPKVLTKVIDAETAMRRSLTSIQTESSASDLATYHFELQDCFDTTDDSLANARQTQDDLHGPKHGSRTQGGGNAAASNAVDRSLGAIIAASGDNLGR